MLGRVELTGWVAPPARDLSISCGAWSRKQVSLAVRAARLARLARPSPEEDIPDSGDIHVDPSNGAPTGDLLLIERICQMQWGHASRRH